MSDTTDDRLPFNILGVLNANPDGNDEQWVTVYLGDLRKAAAALEAANERACHDIQCPRHTTGIR